MVVALLAIGCGEADDGSAQRGDVGAIPGLCATAPSGDSYSFAVCNGGLRDINGQTSAVCTVVSSGQVVSSASNCRIPSADGGGTLCVDACP